MRPRNIALGALAIGIVAVLILGGFYYFAEIYANTDGVAYDYRSVVGSSNKNGGGDLLDSTAYVTSWTGGGTSEKIVIQGHYKFPPNVFTPAFARYWYVVKLNVDNTAVKVNGIEGLTWTSQTWDAMGGSEPTPWSSSAWNPCEPAIVTLTNPASGTIHVEMWGHVNDLNPSSKDDGLLAIDEAYLRSGVGKVKVQNDVVEEGKTADFYVETGYAHSAKSSVSANDQGWFLNVYNPAGTQVMTKTLPDNFAGTVSWPIPNGSYSSTSTNIYKVILRNELINQDDDWFFTVGPGMLKTIPQKPSFQVVNPKDTYVAGDQVTVQITAAKNPIGYQISGFWVWVSYETTAATTTNYVMEKAWYPATPIGDGTKSTAQVTFTFPDAGNVRLEASTADVKNLNSGKADLTWTVYHQKTGGDNNKFDWFPILLAAFLIVGSIVLGVVLIMYAPKPWGIVIGAVIIVAGIGVGLILLAPALASASLLAVIPS